jgi:predicted nucleic acid-binding Zn ribbon protein
VSLQELHQQLQQQARTLLEKQAEQADDESGKEIKILGCQHYNNFFLK